MKHHSNLAKRIVSLLLLLSFFPAITYAQKAYEAVYYCGKTQHISIKFMLANGYLEASEIIIKDSATRKSSTFYLDLVYAGEEKQKRFYHYTTLQQPFTDYFILEELEENYTSLPGEIQGYYYVEGKAIKIILKKDCGLNDKMRN